MIFTENELKKWTLKSQKSQIAILLVNQCSISAVFPIVWFAGDQKTALSGESLYTTMIEIGAQRPQRSLFAQPIGRCSLD